MKIKEHSIEQANKLKEAEEKAKEEGIRVPYAFISDVSGKVLVF
jgi:hypothetical protein